MLFHGDLWTNNLMYTYDDQGNPTDVILVRKTSKIQKKTFKNFEICS